MLLLCCWYKNELVKLENENETLSLDIEKMEKYLAGMEKWKSEAEANMLVLVGELQQKGVLACLCSKTDCCVVCCISLVKYVFAKY